MLTVRALDLLFLGTMLVAPFLLLLCALAPFRERIRREWPFLLLCAVLVWGLLLLLFSPLTETLQQSVIHVTAKPWLGLYRDSVLHAHRAPLWLPNFSLGLPALAHPYTGYFSPLTSVLLLFRDVDIGVNVLLLVHLAFAAATLALVLRERGVARAAVLVGCLALIWNPWVFRRLSPEVHALYLFGFAWLPLSWGLLLRFLRTRRFTDALATGIPLAFMAVSMPTVFAQMTLVVAWFLLAAFAGALWRRQWKVLARLGIGGVLIAASAFLTAAPEHLAASEFFAEQGEGSRFGVGRIYGWRDRALSAREFFRALLPHDLGRILSSSQGSPASFGVPFSPGDAVVVLAAIGGAAAFRRKEWRRALRPGTHLLLMVFLANVATHGIAYKPLHQLHPLWASSGNWPVLGALFLVPLALFSALGAAAVLRAVRAVVTRFASRLPALKPSFVRIGVAGIGAGLLVLIGMEMLWGLTAVGRRLQSDGSNERLALRFFVPTQALPNLRRVPHVARLAVRRREQGDVGRLLCVGDHDRWPSPCFDDEVARAGLELVGVSELGWGAPRAVRPLSGAWSGWNGTLSPVARTVLGLSHVTHVVSTRRLDLPLEEEVVWDDQPGNSEIMGSFLAHVVNGGAWTEAWDRIIRIHRLPSAAPRAFFADAVLLEGNADDAERVVGDLLAGSSAAFHPRKIALLHPPANGRRAAVSFSTLSARPEDAAARARFFLDHPTRRKPVQDIKVRARPLHQGAWELEGTAPRDGAIVLSQLFYPGFRAWVNGDAAPVFRSQLMFTAVPVGAGNFRVIIEYAPLGLYAAGLLTLGFALALARLTRSGNRFLPEVVLRPWRAPRSEERRVGK